jgi:hypothetical protein
MHRLDFRCWCGNTGTELIPGPRRQRQAKPGPTTGPATTTKGHDDVKSTLRPGLTGSLSWTVPVERTVPHLLPESAEFAALPQVLATGYLVGVLEWTCIRALNGHLDKGEATLGSTSTSATTPPPHPVAPSPPPPN